MTMSLQLYFSPGACSFVPHAMLEMSGADYVPTLVKLHKGEQREAAYQAINPRGQVPVLVEDGTVITQIAAICSHLDEKFPQLGFLPKSLTDASWDKDEVMEFEHFPPNPIGGQFALLFSNGCWQIGR
jgi:glutathione S-transferase